MLYTFDATQAFDPTNPAIVAADADILIHAPNDPALTPLSLWDTTGAQLPNPYRTNELGAMPAFTAEIERVGWSGGGLTGFLTSWEGLKSEAVAAANAAAMVASEAVEAAVLVGDDLVFTRHSGEVLNVGSVRGREGEPGEPGERGLPGVNAVENDTAVAAYIGADTATSAALLAKFVGKGRTADYNQVFVSPAGADTNTGRTQSAPFKTLQKAFDYLKSQGPILQGRWEVVLAAGTYPAPTVSTFDTASVGQVIIKGPVAGHPNIPTAILDGTGGSAYSHGMTITGVGVNVLVRDVKFQNFHNGGGDTSRIGLNGEYGASLQTSNVHTDNCSWTGIYAFNAENARIFGGIQDHSRSSIVLNASHGTVGRSAEPVIIRNASESGMYWSRGSQGHADYVVFEDSVLGLSVDQNSRVHVTSSDFKRNGIGVKVATGATITESGNTFNGGTADANTVDRVYSAYSGNYAETNDATTEICIASDRTDRTVTGAIVGTYQTLTTPYTVPAGRLKSAKAALRVKVMGQYGQLTAGAYMRVRVGGYSLSLPFPAAGSSGWFDIDFTLMRKGGSFHAFGKLGQHNVNNRFNANAATSYNADAAAAVSVDALLTGATDSLTLIATEVYLAG